ncbi:MAG: Fur family transcriptional regulator [Bacillota bacterium]|nr:Fur family transcriptional regulator [Bacillota bacterium]HHU60837.1 transcriptional repressor [Natronincola sp.]
MLKEWVRNQLEKDSSRLTPQREAVVDVLIANADDHLSAEDIFIHTKKLYPEIGLATVYRNLELLEKLNIIHRFDYGDGHSRYEIRLGDDDEHYHHHLICQKCGSIGEFKSDLLDTIEKRIAAETGFEVTDHCLRFFGICAQCREKVKS